MSVAIDRRRLLAVISGLCLAAETPRRASAQTAVPKALPPLLWTDEPAFREGPLASGLGANFKAPKPQLSFPADGLLGPSGRIQISRYRGKTLLIPLWAEWCAPCLVELTPLAALNRRFGGKGFEIVPIATSSHTIRTYADAKAELQRHKITGIGSLVDGAADGHSLYHSLALTVSEVTKSQDGKTVSRVGGDLPCVVVVDPIGRVRGRMLGLSFSDKSGTVWEQPLGVEFVRLLASGALA